MSMAELNRSITALGTAFEEFKSSNDERIKELVKGHVDPLLEDKVNRINEDISALQVMKDRLDDIEAKTNRPGFGGGQSEEDSIKAEHSKLFGSFIRRGEDEGLGEMEVKASLTTQSDPDGGYTVPEELDRNITRIEADLVAMRGLATVRPVGSATFKKIVNQGGVNSGWVEEEEARPKTENPKLVALEYPAMEIYAEPHSTQGMLDDSFLNVEQWLADEVGIAFADAEGKAFIVGTGHKQPKGILSYPTVLNSSYAWGSVGYTKTGAAAGFAATDPSDALIDLIHSLKRGYRINANWLMNNLTVAEVRKFKDSTGQYLWVPGLERGQSGVLLGYPVQEDDGMPDLGANALPIAFADFRRAYIITDRMGTRVLRDPYTAKPYVKFYTTKRVGGGMQNFEAIKLMKCEA